MKIGSWGEYLGPRGMRMASGEGSIMRNFLVWRRLRWAGHVRRMEEGSSSLKILTGNKPLRRSKRRWKDNIRMDLKEIGINTRNWVDSAQDRDYWRALWMRHFNFLHLITLTIVGERYKLWNSSLRSLPSPVPILIPLWGQIFKFALIGIYNLFIFFVLLFYFSLHENKPV